MHGSTLIATADQDNAFPAPPSGWHFLQLPGPTNIPERVLSAIHQPAMDHLGPAFGKIAKQVLDGMKPIFQTDDEVFIFPSSGSGAAEAAIANTLSPGDGILMFDSGQFSMLWIKMARQFGLDVRVLATDWRRGPSPKAVEQALRDDKGKAIKAVFVVHNETSTGVTARVTDIRRAIDAADHPALLFVDTISSLASIDYRHDEWGVDVSIGGSQKGLMLPPGLSFNAVSAKTRRAAETARLPKFCFDWGWMRENNVDGYFPYTPAINMLFGLNEALAMLQEEGLDNVFRRHRRLGAATRAAVAAWGLEPICQEPAEYSNSVTAVLFPEGHDADAFRATVRDDLGLTPGGGLARFAGKAFRIGHMGYCSELMLLGALQGTEIGLQRTDTPYLPGGAAAAQRTLSA
jgi:alanine-glyoxylate transaminase/serine-glyoxylate transaminase/serine-pyruvate transaminase